MGTLRNRRTVSQGRPRVEVIPMIDIMMFLLVFFVILTLKMIDGTGVSMEIPGSMTTQDIERSTLTIGVDNMGAVIVDGKEITPDALAEKLVSLKQENTNIDIILAGDKDTSLQQLILVMDTVRGAGINSVAIAARADKQ